MMFQYLFDRAVTPTGIYALQLAKCISSIVVICDEKYESEAYEFASKNIGCESKFKILKSVPPNPLNESCHLCDQPSKECPSMNGSQSDKVIKAWVGPGSPILALTEQIYSEILKITPLNELKTLIEVERCYHQIMNRESVAQQTEGQLHNDNTTDMDIDENTNSEAGNNIDTTTACNRVTVGVSTV